MEIRRTLATEILTAFMHVKGTLFSPKKIESPFPTQGGNLNRLRLTLTALLKKTLYERFAAFCLEESNRFYDLNSKSGKSLIVIS